MDGNTDETEGRVEVYHNGVWGTIWSIIDATVVCKELGYARAIASPNYGAFGTGTGPVSEHIRSSTMNAGMYLYRRIILTCIPN